MRVMLVSVIILIMLAMPAMAQYNSEHLIIDLSEKSVKITTGFSGKRISLFGVKDKPGDIAIIIRGPERRMIVRRKDQFMGMWINNESVRFRNVPAYYDLAMSKAEREIAPLDVREEHGIGLDSLNFDPVGREDPDDVKRFREALIRNKQTQGYFPLEPRNIIFLNGDFFRANFYVPANIPTGDYSISTYLLKDGVIVSRHETKLDVGQVGFSARLYRFAHLHALAYGLLAVLLAIVAGGGGWLFLRRG